MTEAEIETHIRGLAEDDGISIEEIDISCSDIGFSLTLKAEGNPLSEDSFFGADNKDLVVPLRGRECKYHSLRMGEARLDLASSFTAVWVAKVEAWDEYTDAPDTHCIEAYIVPTDKADEARKRIRKEFEEQLVGEIAGDLYQVSTLFEHMSLPIEEHQRESLIKKLSEMTRTTLCLSTRT
tara:strand:- start:530 stop:1072 length:543 start_codon:yes stop_codon:yes gene_type:complete